VFAGAAAFVAAAAGAGVIAGFAAVLLGVVAWALADVTGGFVVAQPNSTNVTPTARRRFISCLRRLPRHHNARDARDRGGDLEDDPRHATRENVE
jgi:hypothetical protein